MRQERMYLHLQFDSFAPEEFTPLLLSISWLVPILVSLLIMVILLMLLALIVGLLLVAHEETFFLSLVALTASEQHERRQNQPLK